MKSTAIPEELKNVRILIVDDVIQNLEILGISLRAKGLTVFLATSGKQALAMIEAKAPDLILLDIQMPEMDGYEVCGRLKSDPGTADIPVIFLTAKTDNADVIKGFEIGGVDYITKPVNSTELMLRIMTHLELKRSRDIVHQQNEQLRYLNATKDKFFSIIAHDLKNPFSILLSYSEMLKDDLDTFDRDTLKDFLKIINETSLRGYHLLENLLEWALSQTGAMKCVPEKSDCRTEIQESTALLSSNAAHKNITVHNEVPPETFAMTDRKMFSTIIRNLLSNAIKFTPENGKITIRCAGENGFLKISVTDTGSGIRPEDIDKLFRIDKMFSTAGTKSEKGSGLGLILCKELVEKNGGRIEVRSTAGQSTTFSFTIHKYDEKGTQQ